MEREASTVTRSPEASAATRRPGPPRNYAPDDERRMMIEAAYRILSATDSGTASVAEILAEAGLSNRAFYRHFRSKDELFMAMFEAESRRFQAELERRVAKASGPGEALLICIEQILAISFDARRQRRAGVMWSPEMTSAAGYAEAHHENFLRQRDELSRILAQGAQGGVFSHTDPASDAEMILDLLYRFIMRRRDGMEDLDLEQARLHVSDFVSRAVGSVS